MSMCLTAYMLGSTFTTFNEMDFQENRYLIIFSISFLSECFVISMLRKTNHSEKKQGQQIFFQWWIVLMINHMQLVVETMMVDWVLTEHLEQYYLFVYYFEALRIPLLCLGIKYVPEYGKALEDLKIMK